MVEVQCSSCHTRYRVDEQVLPEGTPTFKCSRCGHVFTIEPRKDQGAATAPSEPIGSPRGAGPRFEPPVKEPFAKEPPPKSEVRPRVGPERAVIQGAAPKPPPDVASKRPDSALPKPPPEAAASPPPHPEATPSPKEDIEPAAPTVTASKRVAAKISTAELLARSFGEAPPAPEGENLNFDFHSGHETLEDEGLDDAAKIAADAGHRQASERWAVGDDPGSQAEVRDTDRFEIGEPPTLPTSSARGRSRRVIKPPGGEFVDEAAAPIYNRGITHSARFFLMLLFFVLVGFAATTITIHTAPAAARGLLNQLPVIGERFRSPLTPARMVVLEEVHPVYQLGKDGKQILVITGQAENVTNAPLHTVSIAATLEESSGRVAARRDVYCGNNLVSRTISQMTSHEIDFFQSLPPPQGFTLDPSGRCPFVIVFTQPPAAADGFKLAITRAEPAGGEAAPPAS
jgi:predicted Zn finger-like uncharacterized protein